MSRQIRRLQRKNTDLRNFPDNESPDFLNLTESTEHSTESNSDDASSFQSQITSSSSNVGSNNINSIRAELREDNYHSMFADSDFSDDTHDWGGDNQDISDDYWHFLGLFE